MGLLSKAAILAGGYYIYKHHQDKKRAERGSENYRHTDAPAVVTRDYPSQSQFGDYPRDAKPQPQVEYSNPTYESFRSNGEHQNMSGAKY